MYNSNNVNYKDDIRDIYCKRTQLDTSYHVQLFHVVLLQRVNFISAFKERRLLYAPPAFTQKTLAFANLFRKILKKRRLSEGSQSRQGLRYSHESRGTRNQESLCRRGQAAI
jgi:hypothetical protein